MGFMDFVKRNKGKLAIFIIIAFLAYVFRPLLFFISVILITVWILIGSSRKLKVTAPKAAK
jgi:hypothetical protein